MFFFKYKYFVFRLITSFYMYMRAPTDFISTDIGYYVYTVTNTYICRGGGVLVN